MSELLPGSTGQVPEEWRDVVGYEGFYAVSSRGRVKSLARVVSYSSWMHGPVDRNVPERILGSGMSAGYRLFTLWKEGRRQAVRGHTLVAKAFLGPCPIAGMEVLHGNGDRADNRVENLRWGTRSENMQDAVRHGTHPRASIENCLNGHRLAMPNLKPPNARTKHYRTCLACSHARSWRWYSINKRGIEVSDAEFLAYADRKYAELTGKVGDLA